MKYSYQLANKLEEVEKLPDILDVLVENDGVGMDLVFSLNLAIEEALVNVINYAYPQDGQEYPIWLEIDVDAAGTLTFVLRDNGQKFDPTKAEDADVTLAAEDRPIGGLGIFLVRQIMDEIAYRYENGQNILTMIKH